MFNREENSKPIASLVFFGALVVLVVIVLVYTYHDAPVREDLNNYKVNEKRCDEVADTLYLGFHSNMKQDEFYSERGSNPKLVNGLCPIIFDGHQVNFIINPFIREGGCLDYIRLTAQIRFGDSKLLDTDEDAFCNSLRKELIKKYGELKLDFDSVLPKVYFACAEYGLGPDAFISKLSGCLFLDKEHTKQVPDWVIYNAYLGSDAFLNSSGNLRENEGAFGSEKVDSQELKLARSKPIDRLVSVRYMRYSNSSGTVKLNVYISSYNHQEKYGAPISAARLYNLSIDYLSDRFLKNTAQEELERRRIKENEDQGKLGLEKTNQERL